jgi:formiminoglutamase
MNLTQFRLLKKEDVLALTRLRKWETKLGEVVQTIQPGFTVQKELDQSTATYVVFGIPEDIGIRANGSIGGNSTAWPQFIRALCNTQSNDFLEGEEVLVLGHFDFEDIELLIDKMALDADEKITAYRHAVHSIDEVVESLIKAIVQAGKIPIVIGGGHNNAYPCIKGAAKGLAAAGLNPIPQINCINLDTCTGYGPTEGRHSGNAFRYAEDDGFLQRYCAIGVGEASLQQTVWMDIMDNPFVDCITYEDVFVRSKRSFVEAVEHAIDFTDDNYAGVELDLDILSGGLEGISARHARQYVTITGKKAKAAYLHIAEGTAAQQQRENNDTAGRLIALLVTDFIKAVEEVKS